MHAVAPSCCELLDEVSPEVSPKIANSELRFLVPIFRDRAASCTRSHRYDENINNQLDMLVVRIALGRTKRHQFTVRSGTTRRIRRLREHHWLRPPAPDRAGINRTDSISDSVPLVSLTSQECTQAIICAESKDTYRLFSLATRFYTPLFERNWAHPIAPHRTHPDLIVDRWSGQLIVGNRPV